MYKIMEAFLENSCTFINWCVKDDLSVKIAFRKRRVRGIKSYFYYLNLGACCLAVGWALGERRIGKLPTNVFPAR